MPYQISGGAISPKSVTCDNCPVFKQCKFHLKRLGGFKGPGNPARNVGYSHITDAAEGHRTNRSFMSCFDFVNALQPRMDHGRLRREEGLDGEFISIIGQEGDEIELRMGVAFNSRGEIVRPMNEYIEALKSSGHRVNLDDNTLPVTYKDIKFKMKIPAFSAKAPLSSYDQDVYAEALARERAQEEALDDGLAPFAGVPVSEPVKRGPGRPKKIVEPENE